MLMIRSLWGIWLRMRQKRQEAFLPKLTKEFRIRCRFRTMIRYVSMLMFLNVFVMMVFSVKFISSQIADEPEALYPYDYVFLANSQDEAYFEALQQECEAEVLSFPMVRATTLDATEQPEEDYRVIVVQQGQNIGISESTYRELKNWQERSRGIFCWMKREKRSTWYTSRIRLLRQDPWTGIFAAAGRMYISGRH